MAGATLLTADEDELLPDCDTLRLDDDPDTLRLDDVPDTLRLELEFEAATLRFELEAATLRFELELPFTDLEATEELVELLTLRLLLVPEMATRSEERLRFLSHPPPFTLRLGVYETLLSIYAGAM